MSSSLGEKIRQLRKQRLMTQQEFAEGIVTPSMISQIESNRATPSPKLLEQLAVRLEVDIAYFMDDMNQKSDQAQTYRRARAFIDAGQHAEAIPLLLSLVSPLAPQFRGDTLYGELAECYLQLGQFAEAGEMYERVVQMALERSDAASATHALYHLGRVYRRLDNPHMARMYWQRASELLRRHPKLDMPIAQKVESNLGRVCLELGRYSAAIRSYQSALTRVRTLDAKLEEAVIYHGLATAYVRTGDADHALAATEVALELYEQVHHQRGINQCRVNLVVCLRLKDQFLEAVRQTNRFLELPDVQQDHIRMASLLAERAVNYVRLGHHDEAVRDVRNAFEYDLSADDKSQLQEVLADCCLLNGDHPGAVKAIDSAIKYATEADDDGRVIHLRNRQRQCLTEMGMDADAVACALEVAAACVAYSLPGQ